MLRKSFAATALVLFLASPGAAQEEKHQWSDARPDAISPAAAVGTRMMDGGQFEVGYRFHKMNFGDVLLGTELVTFLDVLSDYSGAPIGRTETAHMFSLRYGVVDWLTLEATAGWLVRDRDFGDEFTFVANNASGISDIEAAALIKLIDRDGVMAHLIGGVEIPTGSIEKVGPDLSGTNRVLAYEMQLGTGSFSLVPGAVAAIQNEKATVGAQVKARFRLVDNDRDYRHGDQFDGVMWASYMLSGNFAATTGARISSWGSIEGLDAGMNPSADPGQDPYFSSGTRVDIPLGINVHLTEGLLSGMRVGFEFLWPTYENYDAPRPHGEWGFNFTASRALSIPGTAN